jgi:uncharacterized protein YjbI with pentapeptide repeats
MKFIKLFETWVTEFHDSKIVKIKDKDTSEIIAKIIANGDNNLNGIKLVGLDLKYGDFNSYDLIQTEFEGCDFSNSVFTNCIFENSSINHSKFHDVEILNSTLEGSVFEDCHFDNSLFKEVNLMNTHFKSCDFSKLKGLDTCFYMSDALFTDCFFNDVDFSWLQQKDSGFQKNEVFRNCKGLSF